jgi:ubiquinone/menaquinone biosynthesis C-methylase UbiE
MNEANRIYWELYFKNFSNDEIIRQTNNPIREYEDEMIEGPIIDIGCGQSSFLLEFSGSDREIIAVDNEQFQLDFLKKRVAKQDNSKINNWSFNLLNFPNDELPDKKYSLVIFSNFLHFFTLNDCIEIEDIILDKTVKGTFIYVCVHSYKHYKNKPENLANSDYFKHYFTIEDLEQVFTEDKFEKVYSAEIDKVHPLASQELIGQVVDKYYEAEEMMDSNKRELEKLKLLEGSIRNIVVLFRRK